jgi:hypothetical protein
MVVKVLLTTGERRVVEADGAHVEGGFFLITRGTLIANGSKPS